MHRVRAPARGGGAEVHEARGRVQLDLPSGRPQALAQVGVLAVHEEALVEAADGVEGVAAQEQRRALQELARPRRWARPGRSTA